MGRDRDQPSIGEAWALLGERLGSTVEGDGERSVHAEGTVRGRSIVVDIGGTARNQGSRREFRAPQRQRRASQSWRTVVTVSCEHPALEGREIRFEDSGSTSKDATYVAGSPIHIRSGPVVAWPDRALVGPPWWIDLLCDLADGVDAVR